MCEVDRWDDNVFEPGGYALDSLLAVAAWSTFAVLIASPDDVVVSRMPRPRPFTTTCF